MLLVAIGLLLTLAAELVRVQEARLRKQVRDVLPEIHGLTRFQLRNLATASLQLLVGLLPTTLGFLSDDLGGGLRFNKVGVLLLQIAALSGFRFWLEGMSNFS